MPTIDRSDAHAARVAALARILWAQAGHLVGDPTGSKLPDDLTTIYRDKAEAILLLMRPLDYHH
jgi:hypothetical protein